MKKKEREKEDRSANVVVHCYDYYLLFNINSYIRHCNFIGSKAAKKNWLTQKCQLDWIIYICVCIHIYYLTWWWRMESALSLSANYDYEQILVTNGVILSLPSFMIVLFSWENMCEILMFWEPWLIKASLDWHSAKKKKEKLLWTTVFGLLHCSNLGM